MILEVHMIIMSWTCIFFSLRGNMDFSHLPLAVLLLCCFVKAQAHPHHCIQATSTGLLWAWTPHNQIYSGQFGNFIFQKWVASIDSLIIDNRFLVDPCWTYLSISGCKWLTSPALSQLTDGCGNDCLSNSCIDESNMINWSTKQSRYTTIHEIQSYSYSCTFRSRT